jgi:hypothetical protein
MPLVKQAIDGLIQGVSQQPERTRHPAQTAEEINTMATMRGLVRRPGSSWIAQLSETSAGPVFLHPISFSERERFVMAVAGGTLRVFNAITGAEVAVNIAPDAEDYLESDEFFPQGFRALTTGSRTYLVNRDIVAAARSSTAAAVDYQNIVYVRTGDYATKYTIRAGGFEASYTTPAAETASNRGQVATDHIATQLSINLLATGWQAIGYASLLISSHPASGSIITLRRMDGQPFSASTEDGLAGNALQLVKDTVQSAADLPPVAPGNFRVEVVGDIGTPADNYIVRFDHTKMAWVETIKPGTPLGFDAATMPHALTRSGTSWSFGPLAWKDREVGALETNPWPSFVGRKISEPMFSQGRLGFLCENRMSLSRPGEPLEFFRTTTQSYGPDAPVDVESAHPQVTAFNAAVEWQGETLLFSDMAQVAVEGEPVLGPTTIRMPLISQFPNSPAVRPLVAGGRLFILREKNCNTQVLEYFRTQDQRADADDISVNVPDYLRGSPVAIAGDSSLGFLAILTDLNDRLYVYQYLRIEGERLLASWRQWQFAPGISVRSLCMEDGVLMLACQYPDATVALEYIDVSSTTSA